MPKTIRPIKKFKRVSVDDVREGYTCANDKCPEHNKLIWVSPTFYADAGSPICGDCGDDLVLDHVEVRG